MTARIAAAALRQSGEVYQLPPPARHHDVAAHMRSLGLNTLDVEQGFVTESGQFVDRKVACLAAQVAGQIKVKVGNAEELYTEDLW